MRAGGGKQKGASHERDVCKLLSLWLSYDKQEDLLWRSAMSGGRSTVAFAKGKRMAAQSGDISCIHPLGHAFITQYFVECKHVKSFDYPSLLNGKGHLANFWEEAKMQAKRYDKLPLLIGRQNRMPSTVCLSREGLKLLGLQTKTVLIAPRLDLRIVLFDVFLQHAVRP